jgi:hypothetical protein
VIPSQKTNAHWGSTIVRTMLIASIRRDISNAFAKSDLQATEKLARISTNARYSRPIAIPMRRARIPREVILARAHRDSRVMENHAAPRIHPFRQALTMLAPFVRTKHYGAGDSIRAVKRERERGTSYFSNLRKRAELAIGKPSRPARPSHVR